MAIELVKPSKKAGGSVAEVICELIELGKEHLKVTESGRYYRELRINFMIGKIIRDCNNMLGMSGNFKNGCLYREQGLASKWDKASEEVVCDHAIPISELVHAYRFETVPFEKLIFSPVVRIRKSTNDILTRQGYAKKGHKAGLPLYRYSHIDVKIVTHLGQEVDPSNWSDRNHWDLVWNTPELHSVLSALNIRMQA